MLSKKILLVFAALALVLSCGLAAAGDETWINTDLKNSKNDIYILNAGTYEISDKIIVPDGKTLQGEVSKSGELLTKIILVDNAEFARQAPLILMKSNCVIDSIHLDANSQNQLPGIDMGDGYFNGIAAYDENNVTIRNSRLDNSLGDLIRLKACTDVKIYKNTITRAGHEGVFLIQCEAAQVYDNYIEIRDNTAVRLIDGFGIRIFGNTINFERYDQDGVYTTASHAFQAQHDKTRMGDIEICNNYVYNSPVSAVWLVDKTGTDTEEIWIHHNVFINSGDGKGWGNAGIVSSGYGNLLIENNVFDGTHGPAVEFWAYASEWGTAAEATIRNNIFVDSVSSPMGPGGGLANKISKQSVSSSNNCYYNNDGENALGCSLSSSDYFSNPKTSSTLCAIKWENGKWIIPGIEPKELGDIENIYDDIKDTDKEVTDEEIQEFDDIFDILNMEFSTSGRTDQEADDIKIEIEEHTKGLVYGGLKIAGFADVVYIDGVPYIPDENSVIVKYRVIKSPDLIGWSGHVKKIEKNVTVNIENGTAYAVLKVNTSWYTIKENKITGERKKSKIKTSTAIFKDSCPAPAVLGRPTQAKGILYEYPIHSLAYVSPEGLTAVEYEYDGEKVKHIYMMGERHKNENGVIYTNFSKVNYWKGGLPHYGEFLFINGSFDPEKLTVTAYTPYESFQVIHFDYVKKDYPDKFYADWLFPSFGLFLILGFGAWYYLRKILY